MKYLLIIFSCILLVSCGAKINTMTINSDNAEKNINVEFSEERRLNIDINLEEVVIINSMEGITELYGRLEQNRYSRSAPIPILQNDQESFIVIKPRLKDLPYGDLQINSLEAKGKKLIINYKEVENDEYSDKKLSHPMLIIKINLRPESVKLNKLK